MYFIKKMKNLLFKQQIILFVIAGGLSAMVEVGSFKIFSTIIPRILDIENNFYGIKYMFSNIFVFKQGKYSKRKEFLYFTGISILSNLLSLMIFQIFFNWVFINNINIVIYTFSPKIVSKISAILVVSLLTYVIKKRLIFNG